MAPGPADASTVAIRPAHCRRKPHDAVPLGSPVLDYLQRLHAQLAGLNDGVVATYIPALGHAKPEWFGICLATTDGQVYEVGDTRLPFTIQSMSKPFVYGAALAAHGSAAVAAKVGVEPSGDAFNAISLAPGTGRPSNPMINAGAISASGLLVGDGPAHKRAMLLEFLSRFAGRPLTIDQAVYESERDTGFRNVAIGFMLRNFGILDADPVPVLDLYFQQCSVLVDCRDLALMAATLANDGVHPLTGVTALPKACTTDVLSVMATCGMYDYSGEWTYHVGLPAKSGVAGGILAVLPGRLGIGVYSPPLDARGNSVRGIAVCTALSTTLGLHLFRSPPGGKTVIHRAYTAASVPSNRERSPAARELLNALGRRARVYELQGPLTFATTEVVIRDLLAHAADVEYAVCDLSRVLGVDPAAAEMLASLAAAWSARGKRIVFVQPGAVLQQLLAGERAPDDAVFADVDAAIEWCDDRLLPAPTSTDDSAPLHRFDLLAGLDPADLEAVPPTRPRRRLRRRPIGRPHRRSGRRRLPPHTRRGERRHPVARSSEQATGDVLRRHVFRREGTARRPAPLGHHHRRHRRGLLGPVQARPDPPLGPPPRRQSDHARQHRRHPRPPTSAHQQRDRSPGQLTPRPTAARQLSGLRLGAQQAGRGRRIRRRVLESRPAAASGRWAVSESGFGPRRPTWDGSATSASGVIDGQSGRQDSNLRPPGPKPGALPS